jgi:NADPH:quinone reductase-like Zn-dependent oxidoreductase
MRILEVGAGTGGTTETIFRSIIDVQGAPTYSVYTFTDISAGFFPAAKERFAHSSNMEFKVLDVSQDPLEQGFEEGQYDLVIAANVLHATPSLQQTLNNIRTLLKSDGMLVMTELCSLSRSSNYIFGNFSGWWLGEMDNRPDQPYVPVSQWDAELKATGFSGVDGVAYDDDEPYRHFAVVVAKKEPPSIISPSSVTLLTENPDGQAASNLTSTLEQEGWTVTKCCIDDSFPPDQDIISCLDLENSFFEDISEDKFAAFQKFSGSLGSNKVLWLTPPIQMGCSDPGSAQALGVARTLRSELALNFYTLETDSNEHQFGNLVSSVFRKITQEEDKDKLEPDKEYVINDGVVCVGRYLPFSLTEEASTKSTSIQVEFMKKVDMDKPGMLETMDWRIIPLPASLAEDQVEIQVHSAGLNFRDVVYATGLISSQSEDISLGMEVSGIVRRLGTAVANLSIGDRVMSFTPEGGFSTHVIVKDHYVHKIPESMDFEEAATIQGCFATVVYALLDVGRIRQGTSVLIHSACGGVGLAAIQVMQMKGGEIYATVGSDKKKEYLVENFNIPRERIFNSRNTSFLDGVMRHTGGKGVDLVLNSLTGELLHASWKCVAKFGSLLELGKRDLASFGQLDMSRFLDNRSYCGIDMMYMVKEQPLVVQE